MSTKLIGTSASFRTALDDKVLRALQERELVRLGGVRAIRANVRVIAAFA